MMAEQQPPRTKRDRIERLRRRLDDLKRAGASPGLIAVIQGILDLLADEL